MLESAEEQEETNMRLKRSLRSFPLVMKKAN